jgi:2-haloacid dehalogenase
VIKAVVFDIGNVLVEWQPERHFDRHYGPDRRRALFTAVDLHGMNDRVDAGENFHTTLARTEAAHPDFAVEIRDWHDNWIQLAAPVIPLSVHLMRALRAKGVPVFSLTNFGVETFEYAASIYSFLNEFDLDFVSGRLRVIKPDARIYAALEKGCGIAPEQLLFTDDRDENIAAARARGWQTHLFKGPQGLADTLVRHGLLTQAEARP